MPPPTDKQVRLAERHRREKGRPNNDTDDAKVARCVYLDYHGNRPQFDADADVEPEEAAQRFRDDAKAD